MAESRESDEIEWIEPWRRGVFYPAAFHLSRSLAKRIRRGGYEVVINQDFAATMRACADRPETWINELILESYGELHQRGHAHSLEIRVDGALAGGLYGVTLGGVFFGESMFSRITDGSKLALAHLMARLRAGGFTLVDTQFLTPHLASLGAVEVSQAHFKRQLRRALKLEADFLRGPGDIFEQPSPP